MIRLLSIISIILAIVLFPPATLAFISNNAVPGDRTYPIKRSLEGVIIFAASLHPATRAYFQVDFTKRRYKEAKTLLTRNSIDASKSLGELVLQTNGAVKDISSLSDGKRKTELVADLIKNIDDYNKGLSEDKTQPEIPAPTSIPTPQPTSTPTPRPTSRPTPASRGGEEVELTPAPTPTSRPTPTPRPTQTPRPTPTPTPASNPGATDKCKSGEPLSTTETKECNDKAKYAACATIGLNKAQCDNLARETAAAAASPSPAPTSSPSPTATAIATPVATPRERSQGLMLRSDVVPPPQAATGDNEQISSRGQMAQRAATPTPAPIATPTPTPVATPTPIPDICPDQCFSDQLWVGIHKTGDVCNNTHPDNVYTCNASAKATQHICKGSNWVCNGTYWSR